jgi:hypothetical protein
VSACRKRLKASVFSLPGPPPDGTLDPVVVGVKARVEDAEGSSREWERVQPDVDPVNTMG